MIRANGLAGCTYVEPFAGGAGAGLGLLITGQVEKIVVNDLDPAIHAFWKTLVEEPDFLVRRVGQVPLDVAEWRKQKAIYDKADTSRLDTLGFATLYLNRTNRSGMLNGGPIGGIDQTGPYKIDARFNRADLIERINMCALYRTKIKVISENGRDVIGKHAGKPDTFIYADPPYFEKAGSIYLNNFKAADHEDLAKVLNGKADAPWVLTYDNAPQVDDLYVDRRRYKFELRYSAREVRQATEIVVLSDTLKDVGDGWPLRPDGSGESV
jgi:DNA adenine methylase